MLVSMRKEREAVIVGRRALICKDYFALCQWTKRQRHNPIIVAYSSCAPSAQTPSRKECRGNQNLNVYCIFPASRVSVERK